MLKFKFLLWLMPKLLQRAINTKPACAQYVAGKTLVDMIREDLVAERIAIDSYRDAIRYLEGHDPTTRRMLE